MFETCPTSQFAAADSGFDRALVFADARAQCLFALQRAASRLLLLSVCGQRRTLISSMNKLAEQNLAERTPARWVEWLFHSHPAIAKRIAAAEAWARSHQ